jgi:hypothetical protein
MKRLLAYLFALLALLAVVGDSQAQTRSRPRVGTKPFVPEGLVNESWKVTLTVDKEDRVYKVGESVVVKVTSEQDGYLRLFNIVPGREPVCIFPNRFQKEDKIKAGEEITVPGEGGWRFVAKEPVGKEGLLAYVSKDPTGQPELSSRRLTRTFGTPVPRLAIKRLIVVEGMGGRPEEVGPAPAGDPLSVERERDRLREERPERLDARMKDWASAAVEVEIVGKPKPERLSDGPSEVRRTRGRVNR